jgi:dethiobiotin synthetase
VSLPIPAALLITGTDTDVGKTVVGAALLAAWRRLGHTVGAYKPVESGVNEAPVDGTALWHATGRAQPLRDICPVWLEAPVAPPVAARAEGVTLDPEDWRRRVAAKRQGVDLLVVEGAGGLLSPLWEGGDAAELARLCGLPCLVVAPDRLGVINQVRLVVDGLQHRQLPVAAVVLNRVAGGEVDPSCATNRDEVARWIDVPVVGPMPFTADADPAARAEALLGCPGIEAILPG